MGRFLATPLVLAFFCVAIGCERDPAPPPPASQPASQPATAPASRPAAQKPQLKTLLDVVRANDPTFPTTQPLREAVELAAAARLRIAEPTYLCPRGDVWITREDASPTPDVLALAPTQQTHVTRERVRFVYWRPVTEPWSPELLVRDRDVDLWITPTARLPLPAGIERDWSRATLWNSDAMQAIVVPCADGLSVVRIVDGRIDEQFVKLADAAGPGVSTQFVLDTRGLLAWSLVPGGKSSVARFVDGKWTTITPDEAWPARLVQVVPFLDGTVLAIGEVEGALRLKSIAVEAIPVDEARVADLVRLLGNRNPEIREKAQADLAQVGPGAWPLLRKLAPTQPAEARLRIRALLGNETTPTLGGITPEPGPGRVVCRLSDGGVVLCFDAGASAVAGNGIVQKFAPAWLAVRPTDQVRRMPDTLTEGLAAVGTSLASWGDEWIIQHDVDGPLRWMGNHSEPMTKKSERDFKRFVGIDAVGRWIFKTIDPDGPTLLIDPTAPDPRPRLPVWTIDVGSGTVGWDEKGWPVMKRGGAWVLRDGAWAAMKGDDVDSRFETTLRPPSTSPATTRAADEVALLTDSGGNEYSGGLEQLVVRTRDGRRLVWLLPPEATGGGVIHGKAVLIEADDKLFLCNAPGKLVRLTRQFEKDEPFKLDAVFSRNIPAEDLRRIWKDPAGRLVIASGGNRLSVCFPTGRINNAMANMIPAGALRQALEEEAEN